LGHDIGPAPTASNLVCLVYLVYFVWLVDLVHLVSFIQPKNQTNQIDQTNQKNQINKTNQLNQIKGGSRSPWYDGAGAPVALTLSYPGGWQPGEGSGWVLQN
jgi:hypothetical protein